MIAKYFVRMSGHVLFLRWMELRRNFKQEKVLEELQELKSVEDSTKESCTVMYSSILNTGPTHSCGTNAGRPIKGSRFSV